MSFDFSGLAKAKSAEVPTTYEELFGRLDRRATHASLRPVQVSALALLDAQQSEKDTVIKLSTGSGKTVVGLVYAEKMRVTYRGEPVVYLCPTTQLVDQVVQTAAAIGVPTATFPEKGLPYEGLAGEAVLVCTYDRMFNSRSVFESKKIRPSAIVLDDVHAGVDRVRGCFTSKIPTACQAELRALLMPLCESSDPATWRGIDNSSPTAQYEVPYWIWTNVQEGFAQLLEKHNEDEELLFRWGNISRYMELARVCVSGTSMEISLPLSVTEEFVSYANVKHRLFMSASIKDGSSLISDLGCDPVAFSRLIEPDEDAGAGERMILPVSLIGQDVAKSEVATLCAVLAKQTNVVVLTSSAAQAKDWTDAGAKLHQGNAVDAALTTLRSSNGNFVVFAQRFDGVDLPDEACRVLVIDGIPSGDRLCEQVDSNRQKDSPGYDVRTVNRFEQALGRAVRSSADYAAVLLVGTDLAAFIGRKAVKDLMEGRTLVQVELGRELSKMKPGQPVGEVLAGMIQGLLARNEGWKEAHRAHVKSAPDTKRVNPQLTAHERLAVAYRTAWMGAKSRNFQAAVQTLRESSNDPTLHTVQKAELLYRTASYLHQFDPGSATEAYRSVFQMNSDFPRPEMTVDRKFARVAEQAVALRDFFGEFSSANAALAKLDEIKSRLVFAQDSDLVEQGLHQLGNALGASSSRPEKATRRGPDNLWLFDDVGYCIEAKSEKYSKIFKKDAAQLHLSHQWCEDHVDLPLSQVVAVFATDVLVSDRAEDIAFGPLALDEAALLGIVERLKQLVLSLAFNGPLFTDPTAIGKKMQELNLSGRQLQSVMKKVT